MTEQELDDLEVYWTGDSYTPADAQADIIKLIAEVRRLNNILDECPLYDIKHILRQVEAITPEMNEWFELMKTAWPQ